MNTLRVALLCISQSAFLAAFEHGDADNLTENLMNLVNKSSLITRGSLNWKHYIQRDSTHIETVFAQTVEKSYTGRAAYAFHIAQEKRKQFDRMQTASSGHFTINNHQGTVTIAGMLLATEIQCMPHDAPDNVHEYNEVTQADLFTSCTLSETIFFNLPKKQMEIILLTKCTAKMPLQVFIRGLKIAALRAQKRALIQQARRD